MRVCAEAIPTPFWWYMGDGSSNFFVLLQRENAPLSMAVDVVKCEGKGGSPWPNLLGA